MAAGGVAIVDGAAASHRRTLILWGDAIPVPTIERDSQDRTLPADDTRRKEDTCQHRSEQRGRGSQLPCGYNIIVKSAPYDHKSARDKICKGRSALMN